MDVLVCVKRVPMVGGAIVLTADGQDVDTRMSGFTVSPHEECAVEEAVRIAERLGGTVTVLTLGPPEAAGQLRDMLALGAHRGVLLETDGREWGPVATAAAIAEAIEVLETASFPLVLFGNESADTAGFQVGVRVAQALHRPCVTGIKRLEVTGDGLRAWRERRDTQEVFEVPLPAVVSVREGINLPRYPSLPGRLRARRAEISVQQPRWRPDGLRKLGLRVPAGSSRRAQVLGHGTAAVPELLRVLDELGVLQSRPAGAGASAGVGTEAAGTQAAGTQAAGTQAAGTEAAGAGAGAAT